MKKIGVLFDANGDWVDDFGEGMELPEGHTLYQGEIPDGLFTPKLVNGEVVEGLTQAEIDAIRNATVPPTEGEVLGQQLVAKELQILDLQQQNEALGSNLVSMELRLLALEGGAGA